MILYKLMDPCNHAFQGIPELLHIVGHVMGIPKSLHTTRHDGTSKKSSYQKDSDNELIPNNFQI